MSEKIYHASADEPDWENASKVHDWRNHVGDRVRAIWPTLTSSQRLALALDAQDRADSEKWE